MSSPSSGVNDEKMKKTRKQSKDNTMYFKRQDGERKTKPPKGEGRSRPLNSYLKVMFDDLSMNMLHHMSCSLRDDVKQMFDNISIDNADTTVKGDNGNNHTDDNIKEGEVQNAMNELKVNEDGINNNNSNNGSNASKTGRATGKQQQNRQKRYVLTYKPRSRTSLHMTFFFGGTVLCEIPMEDLIQWRNDVSQTIQMAVLSNQQGAQEEGENAKNSREREEVQEGKENAQ
eukprot:2249432-Ditylum_brightwellii.AAC.1